MTSMCQMVHVHHVVVKSDCLLGDRARYHSQGSPLTASVPENSQPCICHQRNNSEWLHPITLDIVSHRTFDWVKSSGHKWSDGMFIKISYGVFY